jgi:alkylation response protein AidB-like acyl-CoA dehydrogenase
MVKANSVRVFLTKVALDVTSRIYDVIGARGTANSYGFDRYWRDVRTHTLHDSHHYKVRTVGDYFLNGNAVEFPPFV